VDILLFTPYWLPKILLNEIHKLNESIGKPAKKLKKVEKKAEKVLCRFADADETFRRSHIVAFWLCDNINIGEHI
jgi:hypothetical protein